MATVVNVAVVNATRVDFDKKMDWTCFGPNTRLFYDTVGVDPTDDEVIARAEGCNVLVTKEIPIRSSLISKLPSSVTAICEAGTGFNNIDLVKCCERGIKVVNVPAYSGNAVATLVITFVLNFSCSLIPQQRSLWEGDRSNFTSCIRTPHFEVNAHPIYRRLWCLGPIYLSACFPRVVRVALSAMSGLSFRCAHLWSFARLSSRVK
jgi:glycerate dehydrogenase